jgi:HAD superfamily hydrolase (TIGR01509 family)
VGWLRAIVLDFDGLVMDTETPIYEEWRAEYRRRGHDLTMDVWQHALGTFAGFDPCAHLSGLTGEAIDADSLRAEVRARNLVRCREQPLLPGVRERIAEARARALGTAVASSSTAAWVGGWLEHHVLAAEIDVVCTRDDVARVKPAPDLFLLAAARLGVEAAECVVFEDSPNGIRAARAAGMRCVAVPNAVTRELAVGEADLVIPSLAALTLAEIEERLA